MIDYESLKEKFLSDPEVLKAYEEQKAEYEIAMALIQARLSAQLSQKEVARRMHTSQSQVARMESGQHFPSMHSIYKYAQAINQKISLNIVP